MLLLRASVVLLLLLLGKTWWPLKPGPLAIGPDVLAGPATHN